MKELAIRTAIMATAFGCVYGWHMLVHAEHPFYAGLLGGVAFVCGEWVIRRPE